MDQNQQPLSTDYLDEIAAPPEQPSGLSLKKILIFGGIALAVVILLLFIFMNFAGGKLTSTERLAGKLYSTNKVVEVTIKEKRIKDSKLRALNTTLSLTLQNIIRDTTPGFLAKGIKFEKLKENKKIMSKESAAELELILEDARLNGNFDQVYTIEMTHAMTSLKLLMEQVSKGNVSVEMQAALIKGIEDLTPLIEQFESFSTEARSAL